MNEIRHTPARTGSGLVEIVSVIIGLLLVSLLCGALTLAAIGAFGGF